jgi:hypothetical protein
MFEYHQAALDSFQERLLESGRFHMNEDEA